jgi:hypothetical protein
MSTAEFTNRLTVEEALEAWRVSGLTPERGAHSHDRHRKCACVLEALASLAGFAHWRDFGRQQYGQEYTVGFMHGFDDIGRLDTDTDRYRQGYADGQAIAAAVFGEGASHGDE